MSPRRYFLTSAPRIAVWISTVLLHVGAAAGHAINALNNVQWNAPSTTPTDANFGVVTSQRNEPRWLQFQVRFTY